MPTNDPTAPRVVGPRYWCMACPLTFADADSANAHHDATGHNQTHRPASPEGGAPTEERLAEALREYDAALCLHAGMIARKERFTRADGWGLVDALRERFGVVDLIRASGRPSEPEAASRLTRSPRAAGEPREEQRDPLAPRALRRAIGMLRGAVYNNPDVMEEDAKRLEALGDRLWGAAPPPERAP